MTKSRIAIVDMGTNTFNLLIAEKAMGGIHVLFEEKIPVKIGKGGIHKNQLLPDAISRAIDAIKKHAETAKKYQATEKLAFGTSALRGAKNKNEIIKPLQNNFGFEVEIITGDQEAEFIYYGIREAIPLGNEINLILDIGGGSNEFIIGDARTIFWKKSFDLGIARLLELFSPSDPITAAELKAVNEFLEKELVALYEAINKFRPKRLIGAAGTFDTFISMLAHSYPKELSKEKTGQPIPLSYFNELHQKLIFSTFKQREQMDGLDFMRIEMIVLATHFVRFTLDMSGIDLLWHSAYSLKEGVASNIFNRKYN